MSSVAYNIDMEIERAKAAMASDPEDYSLIARVEALLRRAGRGAEADRLPVPTEMTSASDVLAYITGSDGVRPRTCRFTVEHKASGRRTTYSSRRAPLAQPANWDGMTKPEREAYVESHKDDGRPWIIGAMVGPINTSRYPTIGEVRQDEDGVLRFFHMPWSETSEQDVTVQGFGWLLGKVKELIMPTMINFYNEGRCSCCGRCLTVAESRRRGRGPICDARHGRGSDGIAVQPARAG